MIKTIFHSNMYTHTFYIDYVHQSIIYINKQNNIQAKRTYQRIK